MLLRRSIALENLSKTFPPLDEDQEVALLHAPFKGTTLFRCELTKLQKENMEHAGASPCFPLQQHLLPLMPRNLMQVAANRFRGVVTLTREVQWPGQKS